MAPMTLRDLEGYFCCMKRFFLPYLEKYNTINYDMFTHEWESARDL